MKGEELAPCTDCGVHTAPEAPDMPWEWYMVHDHIWKQAGMPKEGFLCIECLEERLGRELTPEDFTASAVNALVLRHATGKLANRLLGGPKPA